MIKLPNNYGKTCFRMMIISFMMLFNIMGFVFISSVDSKLVGKIGNIGTIIILMVFGVLAIPCAINYHGKK